MSRSPLQAWSQSDGDPFKAFTPDQVLTWGGPQRQRGRHIEDLLAAEQTETPSLPGPTS